MKCPNCGYKRQKRDDAFVPATECPSCGIVYSKHEGMAVSGLPLSTTPPPAASRPSAVDPESLKKAKERVEKRLRDRLEAPVRDDRHAQTLELAKKLTKGIIRRRQDEKPGTKKETGVKELSEHPDTVPENVVPEQEEPLLLEEAIGVRIHDGKNVPSVQNAPDEAMPKESAAEEEATEEAVTEEAVTEEAVTEEAGSQEAFQEEAAGDEPVPEVEVEGAAPYEGPDHLDKLPVEMPDTDPTHAYPDDVQVETVVLEPQQAHEVLELLEEDAIQEEVVSPDGNNDEDPQPLELPPAYMTQSPAAKQGGLGGGLKRLLPIIAWLILFSGVIGAVLSWTTISDVQAGVEIPTAQGPGVLPLGLLLGFAYLATGVLGFAFFWVAAMISGQLKDIRQLLMVPPVSALEDGMGTDSKEDNQPPHS